MTEIGGRLMCRLVQCIAVIALALISSAPIVPAAAADFVMKFGTATFNESQHQYIKFYKEAVEKLPAGGSRLGSIRVANSGRSRA